MNLLESNFSIFSSMVEITFTENTFIILDVWQILHIMSKLYKRYYFVLDCESMHLYILKTDLIYLWMKEQCDAAYIFWGLS